MFLPLALVVTVGYLLPSTKQSFYSPKKKRKEQMEEDKKNKEKYGMQLERTKKVTFPRKIPNLSHHLPMKQQMSFCDES
jgi:hypothetical protein